MAADKDFSVVDYAIGGISGIAACAHREAENFDESTFDSKKFLFAGILAALLSDPLQTRGLGSTIAA